MAPTARRRGRFSEVFVEDYRTVAFADACTQLVSRALHGSPVTNEKTSGIFGRYYVVDYDGLSISSRNLYRNLGGTKNPGLGSENA